MTYNGNSQVFSIAHVEVDFLLSGMVKKRIDINSVTLELSGTRRDTVRMVMEGMVACFTMFTLLGEVIDLYQMGGRYFESAWNYIDLFSIMNYSICCVLWGLLFTVAETTEVPAAFDLTKAEDQMKLVELSVTLDSAVNYVGNYTVWTTVNIMACFLRCFKYFAVQDRLMVVNKTLAGAAVDIVHFLVTFFVAFLCFSLCATVMFGLKMKAFHSIMASSHSLFAIANGDYEHLAEMRRHYPGGMGAMYTYVFIFFMGCEWNGHFISLPFPAHVLAFHV